MPNATNKLFIAGLLAVLPASAGHRKLTASTPAAGGTLVCVNSSNYAAAAALNHAKAITARMFLTAGVSLEWHSFAAAACQGARQNQTVMLDISTDTRPNEHAGA